MSVMRAPLCAKNQVFVLERHCKVTGVASGII